jgi:hypothetical protein
MAESRVISWGLALSPSRQTLVYVTTLPRVRALRQRESVGVALLWRQYPTCGAVAPLEKE